MHVGKHNTDEKVLLIAEIGNNHEGDFGLACEMIQAAAHAGADAVKFQTIVPERLVSASDSQRIEQLTRFQFSPDQFARLRDEADKCDVIFLSTPFDIGSVDWLNELVPAYKIASCDNDFWPLIDRVAETGKPVLVSMGLGQTRHACELVEFLRNAQRKHETANSGIGLLHCVVSYPTPPEEAGLSMLGRLQLDGVTPGYSDHTIGIRAPVLAVAAGARIIEKHFTINKQHSDFRDHQLSADPVDLEELVNAIAEVERYLGDPRNLMQKCEASSELAVRRSISAARDLDVGDAIGWEDLTWLRPRNGLKPGEEHLICGRKLTRAIGQGQAFTLGHFE